MIELMITVVVISILAAVALPSYRNYVIQANRASAQAEMMAIANREEQYLLANRAYADKATLGYTLATDVSSKYTYAITLGAGTVPSFTIRFTAVGSQASDGDLTLDNLGVKTPAAKWKK